MDHSTPTPRYSVSRGGYSIAHRWKYNEYRIEGPLAYIILRDRHGAVTGEACIDAHNLDRVINATHWTMFRAATPGLRYAYGDARTVPVKGRKPRLLLHRLIMDAPKGTEVDHENGNGLDCRVTNLRITDRKGNQNNRRQQRRSRQLEDAIARLLACECREQPCGCRAYARGLLVA